MEGTGRLLSWEETLRPYQQPYQVMVKMMIRMGVVLTIENIEINLDQFDTWWCLMKLLIIKVEPGQYQDR